MPEFPVDHLRVYERAGRFVIFNPTIPSWIYTNATGAALLKLVGFGLTPERATRVAIENGVSPESCADFFAQSQSQLLFEKGAKSERWTEAYRRQRKLSSIYLHLTNKCNLSCGYCYRNSSPKITIKRFGDEFNAFLDQCVPILGGDPLLTFSGGEPMIHPDFFSVASHARGLGFTNHLLTNGLFLDNENVHDVAELFSYVKISLDGASEATHALTRGTGSFSKVIDAVWLLASVGGNLSIDVQMTMTFDNMNECAELRGILPNSVNTKFTPMMPMGRGVQGDSYLGNDDFIAVANKVSSQNRKGPDLQQGHRSLGCYAGESHISVADNGNVYPCHLFHRSDFKMGNIFNDPIEDIFFGDRMTEFAESMDVENNNGRCSSCDFRYLCGGGCKANPLHKHGDYRKSDTYCSFIRNTNLDKLFAGHPAA